INEKVSAIQNGTYIVPRDITLSEWLNIWLTSYAYIKVRPSTYASYQAYINNHIAPYIGGVKLQKLTTEQLQLYFNEKAKNGRLDGKGGLSPKTIRNLYNMLHEALQQAVTNKYLSVNVSEGVVLPSRQTPDIVVFKPDEQAAILVACKKERLGFAIELDFMTGLRIGELCALKWSDFDFTEKIFDVRRTLQRIQKKTSDIGEKSAKTQIVEGDTKTKNGKRVIPITDVMYHKLMQHRSRQNFEKLRLGKGYADHGYVFANEFGYAVEPSYLRDVYERILKSAGVSHYKFHTIRHTFATRAIENGAPVKIVSEILGHSSVQLTMDVYCHPSVSAKRSVMEKLEKR
uniref:tyrosine-type recombinase/integrase n=1 Tax=uncultured Ruminococcus sp. TaxID=165186 RepID=UPI00292FB47F